MTSLAAPQLRTPGQHVASLRPLVERLATDDCARSPQAVSLPELCDLVAQRVKDTVLARTYQLTATGHSGFCLAVSNRRLVGMSPDGDVLCEALPDKPSSEVAKIVMTRLHAACGQAGPWSLHLAGHSSGVIACGGSCSGDALLRATGRGDDPPLPTVNWPEKACASLVIPVGPGVAESTGDPALVPVLEELASRFLPAASDVLQTGSQAARRALIVPVSEDHAVVISGNLSAHLLNAVRQTDLSEIIQDRGLLG